MHGNIFYRRMIDSIGLKHTKTIIEYLKFHDTDRVSVPVKYDERSVLYKLVPEDIFMQLIEDFGGERLRPVTHAESDLINIRSKAVKILSKELTEDEIAFVIGLKPRTVRYLYKVRDDHCHEANNHAQYVNQFDLFQ